MGGRGCGSGAGLLRESGRRGSGKPLGRLSRCSRNGRRYRDSSWKLQRIDARGASAGWGFRGSGQLCGAADCHDAAATALRNVTFGPGNLVYATRAGTSLYELEIDYSTGTVVNQREFDDSKVAVGISPIGYGEGEDLLAGIWSDLHTVMVYRRTHLSEEWLALPIALEPVSAPGEN